MHILLIGSGGREHALAWKIAQSDLVTALTVAPGNAGTEGLPLQRGGESVNLALKANAITDLVAWAREKKPDLVVVGPEEPLSLGLSDRLVAAGFKVFGPSQAAARLETDKAFAKNIMKQYAVPTAEARIFTGYEEAKVYIDSRVDGVVVKAAGLAAGKGVSVCEDLFDAYQALEKMMVKGVFGEAGKTVIIEEILKGPEVSAFSFTDGHNLVLLDPCQDHKRVNDNDEGPNTGGMGAYSPARVLSDKQEREVVADIIVPTVDAMNREGCPYIGMLYSGLMLTSSGPRVIEFNARFGDPECQVLMPRLKTDLVELMLATIEGRLGEVEVQQDPRAAVCVVLASGGYPGPYHTGQEITGLKAAAAMPDVTVFHSGTARDELGRTVTAGGRVLGVTALGDDLRAAQERAYAAVEKIHFPEMHFRKDIGAKGLL